MPNVVYTRGGAEYTPVYLTKIDEQKCIGCGRCYKVCGRDVMRLHGLTEDGQVVAPGTEEWDEVEDEIVKKVMALTRDENCTGFVPLLRGGQQERSRRTGTENVPALVGMGGAAEIVAARMGADLPRIEALRNRLEAGILARVPGVRVLGDRANRLGNTACLAFDFVTGEAVVTKLAQQGIAVPSGSACASGAVEPSHVIRAMGVPFTAAHGALRFSLSAETTEAEIDRVLAVLPGLVAEQRPALPFRATA